MGVIWTVLVAAAVAAAAINGRMAALTPAAMDSAGKAVTLSIGLAGAMALWLGLMRVAEEAGLVRTLARAARPLMRRLFPEVPPEHPAMGAMLMNLSANLLGLDRSRVLAFTYAYACLNASWWSRSNDGADIVQWFLKVARLIEPHLAPL